jgi:hypothetical protein
MGSMLLSRKCADASSFLTNAARSLARFSVEYSFILATRIYLITQRCSNVANVAPERLMRRANSQNEFTQMAAYLGGENAGCLANVDWIDTLDEFGLAKSS